MTARTHTLDYSWMNDTPGVDPKSYCTYLTATAVVDDDVVRKFRPTMPDGTELEGPNIPPFPNSAEIRIARSVDHIQEFYRFMDPTTDLLAQMLASGVITYYMHHPSSRDSRPQSNTEIKITLQCIEDSDFERIYQIRAESHWTTLHGRDPNTLKLKTSDHTLVDFVGLVTIIPEFPVDEEEEEIAEHELDGITFHIKAEDDATL